MVSETSRAAWHGLQHRITQSERIYDYIESKGSATIAMVAKGLGMEKSTVSARINGLVKGTKVEPSLELSHIGKCPVTGVTAKFWKPIEQYMTVEDVQQLRMGVE